MRRPFSRRMLLRGGLGLGALGLLPGLRALADGASNRRLLVFFADGGWDTTYVFDPHFGSSIIANDPSSTLATAGGIAFADAASRPSVRGYFERHGARTCVLNGLGVSSISHTQCTRLLLTGTLAGDGIDLPTRVAAALGTDRPLPFAVLSGPRYPGALGEVMAPLGEVFSGTVGGTAPAGRAFDPDVESLLQDFLVGEADDWAAATPSATRDALRASLTRQAELAGRAAALAIPPDARADTLLEVALGLFAEGISTSAIVQGDPAPTFSWDSHNGNHEKQDYCHELTFAALDRLVSALAERTDADGVPLIETTTLLVLSEMGRTPLLNGEEGKDHWPWTSAMLVGAGVAGGRVIGATDDSQVGMPVDSQTGEPHASGAVVDASRLLAGVLTAFDLDPEESFPGVDPFVAPFVG